MRINGKLWIFQTCVTANRILVQQQILEKFTDKFVKAVENLKVGPGLKDLDIAAMINDKQIERVC
jgi:succinate-semialdehyde dehydrogenase/glutarate-semialdehyde dehydrogenase